MSATAFDTLAVARKLKEAGVDPAQAEAHASAIGDAVTSGGLATKVDLAALESRLTWRFLGGMGLLFALLKLTP